MKRCVITIMTESETICFPHGLSTIPSVLVGFDCEGDGEYYHGNDPSNNSILFLHIVIFDATVTSDTFQS